MSGHMASIGFPVKDAIQFTNLALNTIKEGEKTPLNGEFFHKLKINDGIELLAISQKGKIACFKPYFKSTSTLKVKLSNKFRSGDCGFEKKVMAHTLGNEIPFLFDFAYFHKVPKKIDSSKVYNLHLTAFTNNLEVFKDKKEFEKVYSNFATTFFIPSGTFYPNSDKPRNDSEAIFAGEIQDTKVITNLRTKKEIRWIKILTEIGNVDVVYDESELKVKPEKGGIIYGVYWLIGDIDFLNKK